MQKHNDGLNKISIKKNTELIGSCSDDGQIVLTNLSSYRSDILFNHSIEIKHILFLNHYDCLVAADSTGMIMFFAVGFTKLKNKKLT
jgi:WD40 repeat protein